MRVFLIVGVAIFLVPNLMFGSSEYATFESFYKESSHIGWLLAAIFAIIAGAAVFFTGGAASPIVTSIGSWIGGMMGLSGAAATNAGLALLGGGSIASGGFGIIGGTALLTAALSFGTNVVVDYSLDKAISEYKYSKLTEYSKKMITLPLPRNDSGPKAYEDALEVLENIDKDLPIFSNKNQQIIRNAIKVLKNSKDNLEVDESAKKYSLLSLLYFISNDYINAKKYANLAILKAREAKIRRTLPAFIYATSSLYEKDFDFKSITKNYFRYSILAEPDNPLIPLLFSIYLDRMSLRMNDGFLSADSLRDIFDIMQNPSLEDYKVIDYTILLTRYFMRLKLEQQKITSLATSSNETIQDSPKTLEVVRNAFAQYNILINDSKDVLTKFMALKLDDKDRDKAVKFQKLLMNYSNDRHRLASLIDKFKEHQDSLSNKKVNWTLYAILLILILGIIIVFYKKVLKKSYN